MALNKELQRPDGNIASYHRIVAVSYDRDQQIVTLTVAVYKDQASRIADKRPTTTSKIVFKKQSTMPADIAASYALLKTNPSYAGALDC